MTTCRVCNGNATVLKYSGIPATRDEPASDWYACLSCGSDTSTQPPPDIAVAYSNDYPTVRLPSRPFEELVMEYNTNCDYLDRIKGKVPDNSILEVGCCDGAGLEAFARREWLAYGFDVMESARHNERCVIASKFSHTLFSRRFSAIVVREVIEHVADWQGLLRECYCSLHLGGYLQVQTPRPWSGPDPIPYQHDHLQLFSEPELIRQTMKRSFVPVESKYWEMGQMVMFRRQ